MNHGTATATVGGNKNEGRCGVEGATAFTAAKHGKTNFRFPRSRLV